MYIPSTYGVLARTVADAYAFATMNKLYSMYGKRADSIAKDLCDNFGYKFIHDKETGEPAVCMPIPQWVFNYRNSRDFMTMCESKDVLSRYRAQIKKFNRKEGDFSLEFISLKRMVSVTGGVRGYAWGR